MDLATQIRLTRELIDIDSTTGIEGDAGRFLVSTLRNLGYVVVVQPVTNGRFNVFATLDPPTVVFSTHIDCVPPFFPSHEEKGLLYGRGSCDAKGTALAQVAAVERLRARGERRIGLLFVVGEERGSDGAKMANALAPGSKFLVNGEPTSCRMARATRGIYRLRLTTHGRAAHSSHPHLGESAIEKLIDVLAGLRTLDWPHDDILGATHYNIGVVKGGVAHNVVPAHAEAELSFRTVGPFEAIRTIIQRHVVHPVRIDDILVVPPSTLMTMPGFESEVFSFTTDIPFLDRWGTPLLMGPGSVTTAHTADEHVEIAELARAVESYVSLATALMSQSG